MPAPVRADTHTAPGSARRSGQHVVLGQRVDLVDDDELGHRERVDLAEHDPHGVDLAQRVGVGAVDDVQQQVGGGDLLQRRAERVDQLVRQVPDEADGVGQRVLAAVRRLRPGGPSGPGWRTARSPPARRRRSAG